MLSIKGNISDFIAEYKDLDGVLYKGADNMFFSSSTENTVSIVAGDVINFYREIGKDVAFSENVPVLGVSGEKKNVCTLNMLGNVPLYFTSCEEISKKMSQNSEETRFLRLVLFDEHNYIKNRDEVNVKGYIDCEFQENSPAGNVAGDFCPGDYMVYNDVFLYKIGDSTHSTLENYKTWIYFDKNGETDYLVAVVPCFLSGIDNRREIWLYGDNNLLDEILENPFSYAFYGKDERFFTESDEFAVGEGETAVTYTNLTLREDTAVRIKYGDLRVSLPLAQDFNVALNQEDAIAQFIEGKASDVINDIVDYEKQQFVPTYAGIDVSKIIFKIHLRKREDFEEWKTNDSLGWFNSTGNDNVSGDSVYFMGFDEDDIYYQKKKVSETFLRISIYNTTDRRTQKLLYTAKIYLNTADLYGQYLENIVNSGKTNFSDPFNEYTSARRGTQYVISGVPLSTIETEFICTHKYDYNNSTEGFYLHLFPSNLRNNEAGVVFMKCELNNAKYGYSLPLVNFMNGFRDGYFSHDADSNEVYVNMGALYSDMYIPIEIKKSNNEERYEWSFWSGKMACDTSGNLTVNLWEPRVNGGEIDPNWDNEGQNDDTEYIYVMNDGSIRKKRFSPSLIPEEGV